MCDIIPLCVNTQRLACTSYTTLLISFRLSLCYYLQNVWSGLFLIGLKLDVASVSYKNNLFHDVVTENVKMFFICLYNNVA